MDERRAAKRYVLWVPVQLASGEGDVRMLAISRNVSFSGVLVVAGADLKIGEKVSMTMQLPGTDIERKLTGEIVRVAQNAEDPDGLWRHLIAVKFDEDVPELEEHLAELESRTSQPPAS